MENEEFIGKARLKAIPWAKYCIACASQKEKLYRGGAPSRKKYYFAPGNDDLDTESGSIRNVINYEKD